MEVDLTKIMIDQAVNAKQAGGVQFVSWALNMITKSGISNPTTNELNYLAISYPGRIMTDDQKIEIIKKMQKAGINV
jgi:hypothetical protein